METVRIIDPRHPLYGREFRLVKIHQTTRRVQRCVIELMPGVHRLVPLAATNLAEEVPHPAPLPLNLAAVQELVCCFTKLIQSHTEVTHHATAENPTAPPYRTPPALAASARNGATNPAAALASDLSNPAQASQPSTGENA